MLPVSAAFFQQEQARAAKQHNALVKGKSSEDLAVVEKQGNPDSSLVPHLGKAAFVDSSGVGDKHYAIAESILEAERAKHPNWMQQKYKQFEAEHGQLQQEECDSETEDGPNDGEVLCQCPIDLCARDAERLDDFDTWFDQIKNVLRIFRNSRKTKGFAPDHPMITVRATSNVNELRCGDIVYLLGKVGFSPFDATIVKLKLERFGTNAEPAWVARMHATDEGLPDVISLDLFLKYCCDTFDCEEQQVQILQYCGRRFGELDILSMESCEQVSQRIAPAPVTVDEDVEEDDRAVKIRSDLLKKALDAGKDKQAKKPKGAAKPKPKGVKKKTKDDVQKSKQSQRAGKDSGPADAEDVGRYQSRRSRGTWYGRSHSRCNRDRVGQCSWSRLATGPITSSKFQLKLLNFAPPLWRPITSTCPARAARPWQCVAMEEPSRVLLPSQGWEANGRCFRRRAQIFRHNELMRIKFKWYYLYLLFHYPLLRAFTSHKLTICLTFDLESWCVAIFVKPPCHSICRLALLHSVQQLYLVEYGLQHGLDALLPGTLGTWYLCYLQVPARGIQTTWGMDGPSSRVHIFKGYHGPCGFFALD